MANFIAVFAMCGVVINALIVTDVLRMVRSGQRLNTQIDVTIVGITLQQCAIHCILNGSYVAFNFFIETGSCELISKPMNVSIASFTPINGLNYYSLQSKDPCWSNPCKNGGLCLLTNDANGYYCDCPFPLGGPTCDVLNCRGELCFGFRNIVYFAFISTSVAWIGAYKKCQKENMTMIMIKDGVTHQFIIDTLLEYYANKGYVQQAYWIGMNKTGFKYKWVDGSAMDYSKWEGGKVSTEPCVDLPYRQGTPSFLFDGDGCDKYPGWDYFPLCQKQVTLQFPIN